MQNQHTYGLLDKIIYPKDLRKLSIDQLPEVCKELRKDILDEVSINPGHLASSLGAVEITVALHYVFNTPDDRIVWDVGHQAYGHKILTGRRKLFYTNRQLHGIRPFPSPLESPYDTFTCGHASNSISAALGMAVAAKKTGHEKRHIVAVIGDGAMSGGLVFEGLNNVSSTPNDLLIVLNDNDMSIDRAVGGMEKYLLRLDTSDTYNRLRFKASRWLFSKGYLNENRRRGIIRLNNAIKSAISHQQNIFEGMNIRYFGPYNGHDVKELVHTFRQLKDMKGPKLLHLHTIKGKGYKPAEKSATVWHAPGKFDIQTGYRIIQDSTDQPPKFQQVFGETLLELAKSNPRIVGVTPAMAPGCSMNIMQKVMPDRVFDVGIAEEHAVTFSGGMAKDGLQPFCNIYSAFAQRAYDNIIHDLAILNLPVVLCLDRAGIVGPDGPTHHGVFDMAALRPVPHLTIASPMNEHELRKLMYTAQLEGKGTFVIRYPRGRGVLTDWRCPLEEIPVGTGRKLRDGKDVAVLSIGPIGNDVERAINDLEQDKDPLAARASLGKVAHYDMRFLKPLDEQLLKEIAEKFSKIITIEDGVKAGGFGSAVLEWMNDHGFHPDILRMGIPDEFVEHGTVEQLHQIVGIDTESIKQNIAALL
ncbi:MAG: 1-deoxy-D-xylulose-5-phosphate synthase [Prevotella sp.]|jgi:1-deoxy-D-xylulose-5-phosphate synthase|nr:1-deoxy-D-xylulose-5-phosphate synthase [Prevotella sp.]MCH3992336.1 1-deoxy-D-xylulose-5-phosphate synthase [Prevotella sp.]MCH4017078.1 1-deoxy-D-xylulose-5-phosphate synthase [Prevotella sp.]MCH4100001.1 1-deoxy-D-xylulose-5-phosphate synthase [Prevotella sp.]MCH4250731.1 1-deoxy-D-xylulose-5-phosphate synthase [Prevotella sp.]MCI1291836.1 1-deoxy-D-xylulose-5-phosphate synthase [Prevotella sp.]